MDSREGNSPQFFLKDGLPVRSPKLMANLQMQYYVTKIANIVKRIPQSGRNPHRVLDKAITDWDDSDNVPVFNFRYVMLVETHNLITTMSEPTAFGHDTIDSVGIKSSTSQLIHLLQHLINSSLRKSKFAKKWKFSRIIPRYKGKGCSKTDTSSFRPVAVLSTVSKLVERAAQQQLLEFFENTEQLNSSNHAYCSHLSTTTTLLEIADDLHQGIENNQMTLAMALDQTSTFDCISHNLLLEKLAKYKV